MSFSLYPVFENEHYADCLTEVKLHP